MYILINNVFSFSTDPTLKFTASLSAPSAVPVSFDYQTKDLTAVAGANYVGAKGSVTFAPGVTTVEVDIALLHAAISKTLSMEVTLSNAVGGPTIINGVGVGVIVPSVIPTPSLSIDDPRFHTKVGQASVGTFHVTLSGPAKAAVSVQAATIPVGNALPGVAYTAKSQFLTFQPGQVEMDFNVNITGVPDAEGFFVSLTNASVQIKKANGVGIILPY